MKKLVDGTCPNVLYLNIIILKDTGEILEEFHPAIFMLKFCKGLNQKTLESEVQPSLLSNELETLSLQSLFIK